MGSPELRNVGKSQWVLIMLHPMISTRSRTHTVLRCAAQSDSQSPETPAVVRCSVMVPAMSDVPAMVFALVPFLNRALY
jgi:hypothetical protein